jgi:hypothetical protein
MVPRLLLLIALICPSIFSTQITLDLNSLPSTQGWTFVSPSGLTETSVFSLADDVLQQNTMGGFNNIAYYSLQGPGLYNPALPFDLIFSAVVLKEELFPPPDASNGFEVGVTFDNVQATMGIGLSRISYSSPMTVGVNIPSNNSANVRTFDMHWDGSGAFCYFIAGALAGCAAGTPMSGSPAAPGIFFGDGVNFANAEIDVTALAFLQPSVPEPATGWMFAIGILGIICARLKSVRRRTVNFRSGAHYSR